MAPRRFFQSAQKATERGSAGSDRPRVASRDLNQGAEPLQILSLDQPLWTVDQVAEVLGVSVKAVYHLIHDAKPGEGLPIRRLGRHIRVHPAELEAWTRRNRERHSQHLRVVASR